jgi:predicted nucleic acid-binding protein
MKVMIDLNVFLDFLQNRQPHYEASARVLSKILFGQLTGVIPAHAVTTLHYLIAKYASVRQANETIDWLLGRFEVAACDKAALLRARLLAFTDFEDAVLAALAEREKCDAIITRNITDFASSPVSAVTPKDFWTRSAESY